MLGFDRFFSVFVDILKVGHSLLSNHAKGMSLENSPLFSSCDVCVCVGGVFLGGGGWMTAQIVPRSTVYKPPRKRSLRSLPRHQPSGFHDQHLGGCEVFGLLPLLRLHLALSQHFVSIKQLTNSD